MTARSTGSATISFGLVSIPAKIYSSNEPANEIEFNYLHATDGARVKQIYRCTKCEQIVDRDALLKGYEHAKDCYVTFTADELAVLEAAPSEAITIKEFVPGVDAMWVEKMHYLAPDRGADRGYKLLRDALLESGLVGIAEYAARGKQHVVVIRPFESGLAMHQLRYASEVKAWSEVPLPDFVTPQREELELAKQIIGQMVTPAFDPLKYRDEVQDRVRLLIEQKIAGGEITAAPVAEAPPATIDLMRALKASIDPNKPVMPLAPPAPNPNRLVHEDVPAPKRVKTAPKRSPKSRAARAAAARRTASPPKAKTKRAASR